MKKTVLITGASRGIGAATAIYFAQQGYDVGINYCKDETSAKAVLKQVESMGQRGILLQADVAKSNEVNSMVEKATTCLGGIGILINNAGVAKQALFTDVTEEEWQKLFSINVGGMLHTTSAVLPQMINQKGGSIVNISSMWGICGASCEVHYSASKAAIIGATKALAKELAPSNIRVNCVAPGAVDTDMNSNLTPEDLELLKEETPLGKIASPTDIAKTIYFLASDAMSPFTTGQILSPNGGLVI